MTTTATPAPGNNGKTNNNFVTQHSQSLMGATGMAIIALSGLAMWKTIQKTTPYQDPELVQQYKKEIQVLYPPLQSFDVDIESYVLIHRLLNLFPDVEKTLPIIQSLDEMLTLESSLASGVGERGDRQDIYQSKVLKDNIMKRLKNILREIVSQKVSDPILDFKDFFEIFYKWITRHVETIEYWVETTTTKTYS